MNATASGLQQARGEFERQSLARTGLADENLGLAGRNLERDAMENIPFAHVEVHVFKGNDRVAVRSTHPIWSPPGSPFAKRHTPNRL